MHLVSLVRKVTSTLLSDWTSQGITKWINSDLDPFWISMSKFREQPAMIEQHGAAADERREAAMGQAAAEA